MSIAISRSGGARRPSLLASVVLWTWATAAGARAQANAPQSARTDSAVLRVGITSTTHGTGSGSERHETAYGLLAELAAKGRRNEPRVELDLVRGNHYQVMTWLLEKKLDAAFVPAFLRHVLDARTDELVVVAELGFTAPDPAVSDPSGWVPHVVGAAGTDPRADHEAYLEWAWRGGATPPVRLLLVNHLSAGGFLAPLAHASRWLDVREPRPEAGKEPSRERKSFWERWWRHASWAARQGQAFAEVRPGALTFTGPPRSDGEAPLGTAWAPLRLVAPGDASREVRVPHEVLVIHGRLLFGAAESVLPVPSVTGPDGHWARPMSQDARPGRRLASLAAPLHAHGGPLEETWSEWYVHDRPTFSEREVLDLLRRERLGGEHDQLALVLPGGGVKSAYQALVLDHLYETTLVNQLAPSGATAAADDRLRVDHVVGTSGGALMGVFAASMGAEDLPTIESTWRVTGEAGTSRLLRASDVFRPLDSLRWLGFLLTVGTVVLTLFVCVLIAQRRQRPLEAGTTPENPLGTHPVSVCLGVVLITVLTPWANAAVKGFGLRSHVALWEGVLYVATLGLLHFCLCCIRQDAPVRPWRTVLLTFSPALTLVALPLVWRAGLWWTTRRLEPEDLPVALSFPGLAAALLEPRGWGLDVAWTLATPRDHGFSVLSLVLMAGVLLLPVTALMAPTRRRLGWSLPHWRLCLGAIGLLWGTIAVVQSLVWLLSLTELVSNLELVPSYWMATVVLSIGLGAGIFVLSRATRWPTLARGLRTALRYLFPGITPGRVRIPVAATRTACSMVLLGLVGWLCWIYPVAPALYDDEIARDHVCRALEQFHAARTPEVGDTELEDWDVGFCSRWADRPRTDDHPARAHVPLQANLVVTGVDLEGAQIRMAREDSDRLTWETRGGEVYFCFQAQEDPEDGLVTRGCPALRPPFVSMAPSATRGRHERRDLVRAVFASGTPFPIFPPQEVNPRVPKDQEKLAPRVPFRGTLADGGFYHNLPIDAARLAGATQALVVASSPRPPRVPEDEKTKLQYGQLFRILSSLPGSMFNQVQQVDKKAAARELLVVMLAPRTRDENFPGLGDFRRVTVEKMRRWATEDLDGDRLEGHVISWGLPRQVTRVEACGDRVVDPPPVEEAPCLREACGLAAHVHFGWADAHLDEAAVRALEALVASVRSCDGGEERVHWQVVGHSDDRGEDACNCAYSKLRADVVRNALVHRFGIDPGTVGVSWASAGRPVARPEVDGGRAVNRRVEVRVRLEPSPRPAECLAGGPCPGALRQRAELAPYLLLARR